MDCNLNLQTETQQQCRICLQKGDINIWDCKVTLSPQVVVNDGSIGDDKMDKTFFEIINIFTEPKDLLVLTEEFPYLCYQCLEDLKICCTTYEKIKLANKQLNDIYEESINQYIDEEYLIEIEDEEAKPATNQISFREVVEEEDNALNHYTVTESHELKPLEQDKSLRSNTSRSKRIALDSNDAFVVTQFIPATLQTQARDNRQEFIKDDEQNYCLPQQMLTVNLKAVEVKDIENLQNSLTLDNESNEPAIYVCQYCPQAFAKSDYLKTHIQKCHVCKFCTQAFSVTEELFKHLREIHTEHKCVICQKVLSSQTNLRHHIRRVHRINLPAKVTLLDFIKSSSQASDSQVHEETAEALQDLTSLNDVVEPNIQYLWKNEDNIEMLTEHNVE